MLQEDLARTEITLNTARADLKKTKAELDADIAARKTLESQLAEEISGRKALDVKLADEIAARKALLDTLTQVKEQFAADLAARTAELKKASDADNAALSAKIDALTKALGDQADKNAKDMEAMRLALEKERTDRFAAEDDAAKMRKKLAKSNNNTTIMSVLGILLGGIAIAK